MKRVMINTILACLSLLIGVSVASAEEELGIFERILTASGSYESTVVKFEEALNQSNFVIHGMRDMYSPDGIQKSRIWVMTHPDYMAATAGEPSNSISGQVLRMAVYEFGPGKKTYINVANPVAHAYVYYGKSKKADHIVATAKKVLDEMKQIASAVPGTTESLQLEPRRTAKTLMKFNGDGPAKMMAGFANWQGNQDPIIEDEDPSDFAKIVRDVEKALSAKGDTGAKDRSGWDIVAKIDFGDAVYFGISNSYTESKTIRINSDFRSDGKADEAPFPGTDHVSAMPLEVLVVNKGDTVEVVQYGEMWRMQLYYWDSGYLAFTKNAAVPALIENSIENAVNEEEGW